MSELSYNDDSKEEKEALTENDEPHNKSCPLEIHIIIPPPFVKEYYYKDLMWPAPPSDSFWYYFEASQAHPSKRSSLARTFKLKKNFANL